MVNVGIARNEGLAGIPFLDLKRKSTLDPDSIVAMLVFPSGVETYSNSNETNRWGKNVRREQVVPEDCPAHPSLQIHGIDTFTSALS